MLAKAVAHHTTASFIRVVGSEFVQKYLGEVSRVGWRGRGKKQGGAARAGRQGGPGDSANLTRKAARERGSPRGMQGWLRLPPPPVHTAPPLTSAPAPAPALPREQRRPHTCLPACLPCGLQGPRMVRDVFRLAKQNSPSIIFVDEVDAIATARFDAQTGADRCARPLRLPVWGWGGHGRGSKRVGKWEARAEAGRRALGLCWGCVGCGWLAGWLIMPACSLPACLAAGRCSAS